MDENILKIKHFCSLYEIPTSFIDSLQKYELIEVVTINNEKYILSEQLVDIERFIRLHYELEINFEGLDVVNNLLNQIKQLQQEIENLRS